MSFLTENKCHLNFEDRMLKIDKQEFKIIGENFENKFDSKLARKAKVNIVHFATESLKRVFADAIIKDQNGK